MRRAAVLKNKETLPDAELHTTISYRYHLARPREQTPDVTMSDHHRVKSRSGTMQLQWTADGGASPALPQRPKPAIQVR